MGNLACQHGTPEYRETNHSRRHIKFRSSNTAKYGCAYHPHSPSSQWWLYRWHCHILLIKYRYVSEPLTMTPLKEDKIASITFRPITTELGISITNLPWKSHVCMYCECRCCLQIQTRELKRPWLADYSMPLFSATFYMHAFSTTPQPIGSHEMLRGPIIRCFCCILIGGMRDQFIVTAR